MRNRLWLKNNEINEFSLKEYKNMCKEFNLKNKKDVIDHFTTWWCFEFAYFYNKIKDPTSKIKLLIWIDYDRYYNENWEEVYNKRKISSFSLSHAYIETFDWKKIDIHWEIWDKWISIWKEKMIWDEYWDIVTLDYNSKFRNYNIDEKFISSLDPYYDNYFTFSSRFSWEFWRQCLEKSWEKIWEIWEKLDN